MAQYKLSRLNVLSFEKKGNVFKYLSDFNNEIPIEQRVSCWVISAKIVDISGVISGVVENMSKNGGRFSLRIYSSSARPRPSMLEFLKGPRSRTVDWHTWTSHTCAPLGLSRRQADTSSDYTGNTGAPAPSLSTGTTRRHRCPGAVTVHRIRLSCSRVT